MKKICYFSLLLLLFSACKKDDDNTGQDQGNTNPPAAGPMLIVKFKFDSTQVRLNNLGMPESVPAGHGAVSPVFHKISSHYLELAPDEFTQLGDGYVAYTGVSTTAGGSEAIDFSQAIVVSENETFLSIPLSSVPAGTYNWARVSLSYQNYDIPFRSAGYDLWGRIASFVGFNTYITSYQVNQETVTVNANKLQGYWAFETDDSQLPFTVPVVEGQAPGTTVVNPIASTSPVPAGSCVVTGQFTSPFTITGNETSDIVIVLSLSTNKSFEWTDAADNNLYEPTAGDTVVDMGLRGLIPYIE